jgi:hypothetical protein
MEAVEPLSGFEVGGQQYDHCPHSPTPKFVDLFPLLMKQLLSELKTSDLNVDFLLYFQEQLKP